MYLHRRVWNETLDWDETLDWIPSCCCKPSHAFKLVSLPDIQSMFVMVSDTGSVHPNVTG